MIPVYVYGNEEDQQSFLEVANWAQQAFCFSGEAREGMITVYFSCRIVGPVLYVNAEQGINIATRQAREICQYVGITREWYLTTFTMLGLIQWRAVTLNPLLRPEDLQQDCDRKCLFSRRIQPEEYVELFEDPQICRKCYRFYGQLCPEKDLQSLKDVVALLKTSV